MDRAMIDIPRMAQESGASLVRGASGKDSPALDWWTFSPDELQLYTEKVMLAVQAAERERAKELVEAVKLIVTANTRMRNDF